MAEKSEKKKVYEQQGRVEVDSFRETETFKRSIDTPEVVKDSYVPEGFSTKQDFLRDMRRRHKQSLDYDYENRNSAIEDKEFAAGHQWDSQVLKNREGLPNLVINTIPQFTAQIVGDWREARNAIKVLPSEDGDLEVAEIRADLIRAIEKQSRADRVYDSGFESMVQCGDGAWRVAVEYANEDVFDQEVCIRPIDDALSVVWDFMSIDPTGKDATYCFVDDPIPEDEFKRQWPGHDTSTLGDELNNVMRTDGWTSEHSVKVTEYWRMIERERFLVLFEDGVTVFIDDNNTMEEMIETHGLPIKSRLSPCKYAQMHLVTGFDILEGPYEWKMSRLPIIRVTGRVVNIAGKRSRYGLVRFMKDSVRLRNFWRSVAAEQLGYAPKAKWIAPASAVEGRENEFRTAHKNRDPLLIYNDDAIVPPQLIPPPPIENALLNESAVNTQDMKDITGIHDASLGIRSNETSGRAIQARQREGDIAALTFYDNGNAAILETGDVINQLISQVYDGTRIIRVIGKDDEPKLQSINDGFGVDLTQGKYDVSLSTGASYTTRRQEAASAMMEAVQAWPQLIEIAGDLVAKAQDWPGAQELSERLKRTIPPNLLDEEEGPQIPQEVQQQLQEMQQALQLLQQENAQLQDTSQRENREVDIKAYDAETKRLKLAEDANSKLDQILAQTIANATLAEDITPPAQQPQQTNNSEELGL